MKQQTRYTLAALTGCLLLLASTKVSAAGSISGFVWNDLNTNGIQDAGEAGLDSVWVELLDTTGHALDARWTDVNGNYSFDNVSAGHYKLHFANPGGIWQTLQNQGNNDAVDSDADPLGFTGSFQFADGQALDFDAGFSTLAQGCFTPVTVTVTAVQCKDNGTADPADDTFTFAVTATGGTGPWGWDLPPGLMMVPYGTPHTFGSYPISSGTVTLTLHDHDNPACTATVTVNPPAPCSSLPPSSSSCDEKVSGCIKYELLGIKLDAGKNRSYSIRVTNNCSNKLIYTAFQLPNGVTAKKPADNSVYIAPSGRKYDVRNPNFSPFHSIRFKSRADSISNGASDIFEYTLPPQSAPDYIHVITRVAPKIFYEAHLNTFNCVPLQEQKTDYRVATLSEKPQTLEQEERGQITGKTAPGAALKLYPNPSAGLLYADLSPWNGQTVQMSLFNSQGYLIRMAPVESAGGPFRLEMADELPNGLYFLEVGPTEGQRQVQRFLLKR